MLSIAPTRRRTVAAARLTSACTASSVLLLASLLAAADLTSGAMSALASPLGAWLAVTFTLLALARRAAFFALWLLTLAAWVWQVESLSVGTLESGLSFAFWSALAAPLYVVTVVGFDAPGISGTTTRARRVASVVGIAGWIGLLVAAARFPLGFYYELGCFGAFATTGLRLLDTVIAKAWLVVPPVVALDAIRRVHRALRLVEPRWDEARS